MSEKIEVRIGIIGAQSTKKGVLAGMPTYHLLAKWLAKTLEMSLKRSLLMVDKMVANGKNQQTGYITVVLNFRQLGRYTALRRNNNLAEVWKYPYVIKCEYEEDDAGKYDQPIELRPFKRS